MQPLVSIVTPCYNHAAYLGEYFEGLLSQTYRHIELIVIDDQSTDSSREVICQFRERAEKTFARVVCKRNEQNLGLFGTLIETQKHVTGDLLCILESDDYYYPTKVEENVRYLSTHPDVGVVHGDVDFLYANGTVDHQHWKARGRIIPQGRVFEALLQENHILTCSFCCRTELFQQHVNLARYAERGYMTADYAMFLDLARHTQFGYIDEALAAYRVVPGSISHPEDLAKAFRWKRAYYRVKRDYIRQYGASPQVEGRAQRQYHKTLFESGYQLGLKADCEQGYAWLVEHYPQEYQALPQRLRAWSVRHRLLWWFIRWVEGFVGACRAK